MEQELAHRHDLAMYRLRNNFQVEEERLTNSGMIDKGVFIKTLSESHVCESVSVCLSMCMSVCVSVYLSVYMSVCVYVCLCVCSMYIHNDSLQIYIETVSGSHSLQDKEREKIHQAQLRLAKLETDKLCMDDEELVRAKHELHRLRRELQDEELNEKQQMCQLEQDKLEKTMRQVDEEEVREREEGEMDGGRVGWSEGEGEWNGVRESGTE